MTDPIIIKRGHMKGTVEAASGLRVALMVPGDRGWRKCYEYRAEGVIESVLPAGVGPRQVRVLLDGEHHFAGKSIDVYADRVTALDDDPTDAKRGPGRPRKPEPERIEIRTRDPEILAAYEALGEGRSGGKGEAVLRRGFGLRGDGGQDG